MPTKAGTALTEIELAAGTAARLVEAAAPLYELRPLKQTLWLRSQRQEALPTPSVLGKHGKSPPIDVSALRRSAMLMIIPYCPIHSLVAQLMPFAETT